MIVPSASTSDGGDVSSGGGSDSGRRDVSSCG